MHEKSRIKHALNTTGIQWLKNVSIKHLSFLFYIEFFEPLKRFELFKNLLFFIFMSMNGLRVVGKGSLKDRLVGKF